MPCSCFNMGLFSSSTIKLIRTPQEMYTTSLFPESSMVTNILSTTIKQIKSHETLYSRMNYINIFNDQKLLT